MGRGPIYNLGFQRGINEWRQFLKPGGVLVASEITWLQPDVPKELKAHWEAEYPEVATAPVKLQQLEDAGYCLLGYFPLTPACWLEHYYEPLERSFSDFLERQSADRRDAAAAIITAEEAEIDLYRRHQAYVSYGMYIAQKL